MSNSGGSVQCGREPALGLTVLYAIDRMARRLTGRCCVYPYAFYAQPIPPESTLERRLISSMPDSLRFQKLDSDDGRLAQFGIDRTARQFRFAQDAVCLCLGDSERIWALMWYAPDAYNEDEVFCRYQRIPEETTVWDFGVEVLPELRNTKMFARIWALANREFRNLGITHSLSRITRFNEKSIKSHERLGAQYIGKATFFRIGRFQIMFSNLSPFVHVTLTGRGPTLTFRIGEPAKTVGARVP